MLTVIYRLCELDAKEQFRPEGFSKMEALDNFLDTFGGLDDVKLIFVHDGPEGALASYIKKHSKIYPHQFVKIFANSNLGSLLSCFDVCIEDVQTEFVYFCEDDYYHHTYADKHLMDGLKSFPDSIVSLYDHPDRYTRNDDIGTVEVKLAKLGHWRTAESTTCTWATSTKFFKEILHKPAKIAGLNDRDFFRGIYAQDGIRLYTSIPGYSTHCHMPYISPYFKLL